jgi:AcrR family transcriptional regulator
MSTVPAAAAIELRILDTAETLFYATGIQSVGVDAVCAHAGVSKRTLYKHFPSKEALVAAYLMRLAERRTLPDGRGDPMAALLGMYDTLERWFARSDFRGCPFVNAVAEVGGDPLHPAVPVAAGAKDTRREWIRLRLVALGARDAGGLAEQLLLLFEGAIATSLVRGGDPAAARAARDAALVLMKAAGAGAAASAASG